MANDFDIKYWLDLSLTTGVGGKTLRTLLAAYDSPQAVLAAPEMELRHHVSPTIAGHICRDDRSAEVAAAQHWLKQDGRVRHIVTLADEAYPQMLLETDDPPALLYAAGDLSLLQRRMVAIVGSRSASSAGLRNTEIFARALADAGCCIVSGLAQGVDAAAHKGALAGGGTTIAVIATGMDIVYPREHRALATDIVQSGLLLSEFPLGTKPLPTHFPRRNRIISGLADACLVMEATLRSGSLITAQLAAEQGRDVFAVPGSINSPLYRGCHQLIKNGARLAENVNDVLDELNILLPPPPAAARRYEESSSAGSSRADGDILPFINYEPTSIDDIALRSGVSADALMPVLLDLEMAGKIVSTAGGCFQRV